MSVIRPSRTAAVGSWLPLHLDKRCVPILLSILCVSGVQFLQYSITQYDIVYVKQNM